MKNQKINKLPSKEAKQESFEEKRIQAFRQFMVTHFKEISFTDRLYKMHTTRAVN
jgi:hypothetical protein